MGPDLPSRGPYSPWSIGPRTVLAQSCVVCGVFADGDSFPKIRKYSRRECHLCFRARKRRDRQERGIGVPPPRPPENLQINRHILWSKEDDDFLRDHLNKLPVENIAVALGRSINAIYVRRAALGLASMRVSHRVAQPWTITLAS